MKRNKHVLINLNEDQFMQLCFIAEKQRRKIADAAYLMLVDSLDAISLKLCNLHDDISICKL